jgi:hypothetical protein
VLPALYPAKGENYDEICSEPGRQRDRHPVQRIPRRPHLEPLEELWFPLETVARTIKKGAHVLVEGSLISSTYEQVNGKGKKAKIAKVASWSIRADVVRKLDREPEPEAAVSSSQTSAPVADSDAPF